MAHKEIFTLQLKKFIYTTILLLPSLQPIFFVCQGHAFLTENSLIACHNSSSGSNSH